MIKVIVLLITAFSFFVRGDKDDRIEFSQLDYLVAKTVPVKQYMNIPIESILEKIFFTEAEFQLEILVNKWLVAITNENRIVRLKRFLFKFG
ncbi:hypothetical protein EOL94_01135 [bacterium]|nr:hypothetical protein [bacterium]